MLAFIQHLGVLAVPAAFACMALIEATALCVVLLVNVRRRLRPWASGASPPGRRSLLARSGEARSD
jgi:hypothetical protein